MPRDWEIPGPQDEDDEFGPGSPDWDLSEEHGYMWDPKRRHWPVPPWLLIGVSLVVIFALLLPALLVFR
ncbi:MAG: hypothetical protein ACYDEB_10930 [Dehalococcoidia bacterium]